MAAAPPGVMGRPIGSTLSSTQVTVIVPDFYGLKTPLEKLKTLPLTRDGVTSPTLVMAIPKVEYLTQAQTKE